MMSLWMPRKQMVNAGVLPLVINAFTSEWLASRSGNFFRRENPLISHELEVESVPELVWMLWEAERPLPPAGDRTTITGVV
jgi:hypothetical protein